MKKKYTPLVRFCQSIVAVFVLSSQVSAQSLPVIHSPAIELVDTGFVFTEGPVWSDSLGLLFSDVRGNAIYRYAPTVADTAWVFIAPSGNSNGLKWDSTNGLLLAQHGKRRIARIKNGVESEVVSRYKGKRLNSPNDLTVKKSDGSIFFTDPPYGIVAPDTSDLKYNGVFRVNPKGQISLLDSTIATPNGIVFSPDEKVLYVNNSANRLIYKWDVLNDSTFANKQVFANVSGTLPGNADGMTVDSLGNVYATGSGGIWIISPNGTVLDTILIPGQLTNVAFGGRTRDTLYITAATRLYRVFNSFLTSLNEGTAEAIPSLFSVYPNPAASYATIPVSLPRSGYVKLQVLNLQGQVVADLADGNSAAGEHRFNWDCGNQRGLYLIKLTYNDRSYAKTCVVNGN